MHTFILKSQIDKKMFPSILFSKNRRKCGIFAVFSWIWRTYIAFQFFQILFFTNHYCDLHYPFKKSDWQRNVSFYFIFEKPKKMRDIRGFLVNWANVHSFWNFDPKFGFSDQKRFRKVLQTLWRRTWPKFCCIVYILN